MPERTAGSWTVMIDALMKRGRVDDAVELLEKIPFRSVIASTAAASGFVRNGLFAEALLVFRGMLASNLMPNEVTLSCAIKACVGGREFALARSVVGLIVKTNFERNLSVCNSLITLHLRMGDFWSAMRVFDEMEERDVVSWTTLIDVHAEMGDLKGARRVWMKCLREMRSRGAP
uniref:Pentatricopeptide repeat-containing protein n=1 Tax=Ananas comosus var. bracteatus TaxID=296719 RepID=A0A6V7NZ72_ANACO|nr:unnamed protein product [Ananas comosus var. bracteatus]